MEPIGGQQTELNETLSNDKSKSR